MRKREGYLRQGDLLFVPTTGLAVHLRVGNMKAQEGARVLAKGEATGHHHQLALEDVGKAQLYAWKDQEPTFIRVLDPNGVTIVHEEHGPVHLPKLPRGRDYEIHRAREYDYRQETERRVVD